VKLFPSDKSGRRPLSRLYGLLPAWIGEKFRYGLKRLALRFRPRARISAKAVTYSLSEIEPQIGLRSFELADQIENTFLHRFQLRNPCIGD